MSRMCDGLLSPHAAVGLPQPKHPPRVNDMSFPWSPPSGTTHPPDHGAPMTIASTLSSLTRSTSFSFPTQLDVNVHVRVRR